MNNQQEKQDFSNNLIVLCLLVFLQTTTLIFCVAAAPWFSKPDPLGLEDAAALPPAWQLWVTTHYWTLGGWLAGLTAVFAIITVLLGLVHRYQLVRILEAEAAQNPLSTITQADETDVTIRSRRNRPHLVIVETIGVSLFALVAVLITLFGRNRQLDQAPLSALYFATAAVIIWLLLEALQLYYLLPRQPRTANIIWGFIAIGLRLAGALLIWVYIGLGLSIAGLELLLLIGSGLLLLGMVCQCFHLIFDRQPGEGQVVRRDKLTHISNITPPIENVLNQQNILTFEALAAQTPVHLEQILAEASGTFTAVTTTWPYQANLTQQANPRLKPLQEKLAAWNAPIDPLQRLEGVNEQIEQQLWERGFFSYRQLAQSSVETLNQHNPLLLGANGRLAHNEHNQTLYQWPPQFVSLWPRQAQLLHFEATLISLIAKLPTEETKVAPPGWAATLKETITQRLSLVRAGLDRLRTQQAIAPFQLLASSLTPEIEAQLHSNGLLSYEQLIALPTTLLQMLLAEGKFKLQPGELKQWQARAQIALDYGVENLHQHPVTITSDPLEQLEGVDAATKQHLNRHFHRFTELANLTGYELASLRGELHQAATYPPDPVLATWPYQAALAEQPRLEVLQQFQADLRQSAAQSAVYKAGLLALGHLVACEAGVLAEIVNHLSPYERDIFQIGLLSLADVLQAEAEEPPATVVALTGKEADDLTRIQAITPAIAACLQRANIRTYRDLANAADEQLRRLLDAHTLPYQLANLLTWRYQAQVAAAGAWERLAQDQALLHLSAVVKTAEPVFTRIIGLDSDVESCLRQHGVGTLAELAATPTDKLQKLVAAADPPLVYRLLDLLTWPQQAYLLENGRFDELEQLQLDLLVGYDADDLTRIEGIGPKIQQLLQQANIRTFAQLAKSEVATLRQILEAAGGRFRLANNPETWPKQAALAKNGRWAELQTLQNQLKGGK